MSEARASRVEEGGFTLIELLVVLLIVGILLAIAIPTYLSVTDSANDTSAQANLYTALTGARTYFLGNGQSYTNLYANFGSLDTGLSYVDHDVPSAGPHVVSIDVLSDSALVMTAYGPGTPDCWGVVDLTSTQGTPVLGASQVGTLFFEKKGVTPSSCHADAFTGASSTGLLTSTAGFAAFH